MTISSDKLQSDSIMSVVAQTDTHLDRFKRLAIEAFSNEGKAERWLHRENPTLGNKRPIDLIDSPEGRKAVEATLIRIESGTY